MVTDIFSLRSPDDIKKNAIKNGDNSGHGLNSLHVNWPWPRAIANVQISQNIPNPNTLCPAYHEQKDAKENAPCSQT